MEYGLPVNVRIGNLEYAIQSDYRSIMGVFEAMNEENASDWERIYAALQIFYMEFEYLPGFPQYTDAIREMYKFINGGKEEKQQSRKPQLISWEKDFPYICAAVNHVLGYDVRSTPQNVHWWTFLSAFMEIGDCTFSQIVGIRSKKFKNKKLDKAEEEFYRHNREIVDIPTKYSKNDMDVLRKWL